MHRLSYFCGMDEKRLAELKDFLDEKADLYNHPDFILDDPIAVPHMFFLEQDVEISAFLTATIAWGNRKSILKSAEVMMNLMENSPFDFVQNFTEKDLRAFPQKAIHRTFNTEDFKFFLKSLQRIYHHFGSLENLFVLNEDEGNFYHAIQRFRTVFFEENPLHRSKKHVASTYKNASAKRLIMFLRWMVRKDAKGVDFGIWKKIDQKNLSVPLDIHTGNIARKLELITRTQNDWKTVEAMDLVFRNWRPEDPAIYDFALFGLGVSGDFK